LRPWARGKSVEIASFLGPADKADLATNLSQALVVARHDPRFLIRTARRSFEAHLDAIGCPHSIGDGATRIAK